MYVCVRCRVPPDYCNAAHDSRAIQKRRLYKNNNALLLPFDFPGFDRGARTAFVRLAGSTDNAASLDDLLALLFPSDSENDSRCGTMKPMHVQYGENDAAFVEHRTNARLYEHVCTVIPLSWTERVCNPPNAGVETMVRGSHLTRCMFRFTARVCSCFCFLVQPGWRACGRGPRGDSTATGRWQERRNEGEASRVCDYLFHGTARAFPFLGGIWYLANKALLPPRLHHQRATRRIIGRCTAVDYATRNTYGASSASTAAIQNQVEPRS